MTGFKVYSYFSFLGFMISDLVCKVCMFHACVWFFPYNYTVWPEVYFMSVYVLGFGLGLVIMVDILGFM